MAFADDLDGRAIQDYADFVLPHLDKESHLLDLGCGDGVLAVGLAEVCGRVTAVDLFAAGFDAAKEYAAGHGLDHLAFVQADALCLPFADGSFDAVFAHSVLESGLDPSRLLSEAWRVLAPGGALGVASVDYGGLLLAGPGSDLLRSSNEIREQVWATSGADPFLGRELRRLVHEAGFVDVEATTKAFSYGTPPLTRLFALGRSSECSDPDYAAEVVGAGLATQAQLDEMATAWSAWGDSEAAYASFTWCRATARRP